MVVSNLLTVVNTATEFNIHSSLGYALLAAPSGMQIGLNGVITWTPTTNSPATNLVIAVVTNSDPFDTALPHLGATNSFTVYVVRALQTPTLSISFLSNSAPPTLTWNTDPGIGYLLQYKAALTDADWTQNPAGTQVATGFKLDYVDTPATNAARFYRIERISP